MGRFEDASQTDGGAVLGLRKFDILAFIGFDCCLSFAVAV